MEKKKPRSPTNPTVRARSPWDSGASDVLGEGKVRGPARRLHLDAVAAGTGVWTAGSGVSSGDAAAPSGTGPGAGDTWTWTALDADSKLIVAYFVGGRDSECAMWFMDDLRSRLANRVQLTSDGHKAYLEAVEGAFGGDIDYAMLVKMYGVAPEGEKRYSPAICTGAHRRRVEGDPDPKHVSTSYVERSNLTMRMHMRRFTRLTNAFSKKVENHAYAVALHVMYYNFVRIHSTLRMTPAMASGVSEQLWEIGDIVKLVEDAGVKPGKRGPYKRRNAN